MYQDGSTQDLNWGLSKDTSCHVAWNFDVTLKMHSSHEVNSPNAMGLLYIIPEKKIICSLFYNKVLMLYTTFSSAQDLIL